MVHKPSLVGRGVKSDPYKEDYDTTLLNFLLVDRKYPTDNDTDTEQSKSASLKPYRPTDVQW